MLARLAQLRPQILLSEAHHGGRLCKALAMLCLNSLEREARGAYRLLTLLDLSRLPIPNLLVRGDPIEVDGHIQVVEAHLPKDPLLPLIVCLLRFLIPQARVCPLASDP